MLCEVCVYLFDDPKLQYHAKQKQHVSHRHDVRIYGQLQITHTDSSTPSVSSIFWSNRSNPLLTTSEDSVACKTEIPHSSRSDGFSFLWM